MSRFNRKCSLLTQYLKEKGDLPIGMSSKTFPRTGNAQILKQIVAHHTSCAPTAQMTIFYAGQVVVFDDFPAHKVKEVMLLAGRSSSEYDCPASSVPPTHEPVSCDLPLARRNSLHRFLEKRKDRITTRAPYPQINSKIASTGSPRSKLAEPLESNKSWLSLSAHSC